MKLPDANVLVYALNPHVEHHDAARAWLQRVLSGTEPVLMSWLVLAAVLRLLTRPGVLAEPLEPGVVLEVIEGWLARRNVVVAHPDADHPRRLRELLASSGASGNAVNDAHLAALALQYRATIVTFDADFARFPGVASGRPTA